VQISEKSSQNVAKSSKRYASSFSFLYIEISAIQDFPMYPVGMMFSFIYLKVYFCLKT